MYNFRYHLVTIVSIFAALALGLLLGVAITGSDLVRDASDNLAESLTDQFNELSTTNENLTEQLESQQLFSRGLLGGWERARLEGRTIAILTRAHEASDPLTSELSALISRCGGVPVVVRIDPSKGFGLDDEATLSALKQLLPEVEGEAYEATLGRALANEWSSVVVADEGLTPAMFATRYPLTSLLVEKKRITVTTAYQPLTEALGSLGLPSLAGGESAANTPEGAEAGEPSGPAAEAVSEALALARQHAAYELAEGAQLPYGVNGVIDTAIFSGSTGGQPVADAVATQITLAFEKKGLAGDLHYLSLATHTGAVVWPSGAQEPSNANRYTLLVQQGDFANATLALSQETGISCELSPFESMGSYGIVALLTGAEKGAYGLGRTDTVAFPPIPSR
ncbi:MAG: copper transporter [Coriobacteriales bacterium]|jgi:hypothetical protein|nr:copper transporter [Coriobacteriales bacterium]